jgi:hypothetical protein
VLYANDWEKIRPGISCTNSGPVMTLPHVAAEFPGFACSEDCSGIETTLSQQRDNILKWIRIVFIRL